MIMRLGAFVLVRLLAVLGMLTLAASADTLGPYGISALVLLGEVALGYAWGRAEAGIALCRPASKDPQRLFARMAVLAAVESLAAFQLLGGYASWFVVWRVMTAYVPFAIAEAGTFHAACQRSFFRTKA